MTLQRESASGPRGRPGRDRGLSLSACKEVEEESAAGYEPAQARADQGQARGLQRVTFTEEGAARVGPPDGDGQSQRGRTRSFPTRR